MRYSSGVSWSRMRISAALAIAALPQIALGATCGKTHAVASGEGCWSIYTDAKITQAQLLAMNSGLDCAVLQLGQQLCVAPSCSKFYTVVSGDYCSKIETEQSISDANFLAFNPGLACTELFPGQSVCVAASASTTQAPTSTTRPTTSSAPVTTALATTTVSATSAPSPTSVNCGRSVPVAQGDTCYNLATANGLQLPQFTALNPDLNCTVLQAGDVACVGVACGQIYKVQDGDWCAKIESDWSLPTNQLTLMNPGLSCTNLAASQNLCVEAAEVRNTNSSTISLAPLDPYPALSPGTTVPQSPILAFASVDGNARSTFYGETIFQSDSQHLDAFAHNDMNSDGKLDRSELQIMMSMDPSVVRGISEVNSTLTADNLVTEMLKSADLNGDGSIDKDEFLFAIRQVQNATNVVTELAADNTALGQQRKRFIPVIIATIAAIIGLVIADVTLFFQILAKNELFRGNDLLSYLDIRYWDGKGSPPSCSAYMYWSSNCGAIGSKHAKSCSNGGERVFGSSCVTHFNSGSAGCGFLGCKSLCYDYNLDNCDCGALKYQIERETECTDTPYSTTDEQGVAACRTKCGNTSGCMGFSVSQGKSDTMLSCKVYKTLSTKKKNSKYTMFVLVGGPAGTPGNEQCEPLENTEFTPWPASTMADDIAFGETLSSAYSATGKRKVKRAAPSSYDKRKDAKYSTTVKDQTPLSCGLCAPFSFTTAVEGTHKMFKKGYSDPQDLSPVWVGRCKGGQSCDAGKQGGNQQKILSAVGNSYIYLESCISMSTVKSPNCKASCGGGSRRLPYVSGSKIFSFSGLDKAGIKDEIELIKSWISTTGPVMANMCYNDAFTSYLGTLSATSDDKVFWDKDPQWKSQACGKCNHAITVVGYFETTRDSQKKIVWIIQNSYGPFVSRSNNYVHDPLIANHIFGRM
ncbi:hypothetical protein BDV93DRAFT_97358 [Ceratobasidium sp. AG-I]|nr:hypothetical protein BDV93DRAFT_97358 [Ceratobasidium sp. AG-I]